MFRWMEWLRDETDECLTKRLEVFLYILVDPRQNGFKEHRKKSSCQSNETSHTGGKMCLGYLGIILFLFGTPNCFRQRWFHFSRVSRGSKSTPLEKIMVLHDLGGLGSSQRKYSESL